MEGLENIDLGLDVPAAALPPAATAAKGKAPKAPTFYKGKAEYAPPFYTVNVQHVEHMSEYEVVGVNGEVIQITRGIDVPNIPQAFLNVLKQSITSKLFTKKLPDGTEEHEWKPVAAIPFSIVEGPYQERKKV